MERQIHRPLQVIFVVNISIVRNPNRNYISMVGPVKKHSHFNFIVHLVGGRSMEGGGGMGSEDGMGDDMGDGQGGGGPGGRGMDSVDHDVGTPATGPTLVEQVRYSTWCI